MYTTTLSKMSSEKSCAVNPPGFVPFHGQGLRAKESQLGAFGTKEWLKSIKLHKYWPLISHWSYWQMMALTEENMEYNIHAVGGTAITRGAQGKLLRSIEELRDRKPRLEIIINNLGSCRTSLETELSYILTVVYTPFPTSEEDPLPTLVVHSIQKVKEHIALNKNSTKEDKISIDKIVRTMKKNPVLYRAEEHLKRMPFFWEIQSTLTNYAVRSSRILPHILRERSRSTSDFEEHSNVPISTKDDSYTSPVGMNLVKLELPTGNEYQKLLIASTSLYRRTRKIHKYRHEKYN